jgi:hypothetical protein
MALSSCRECGAEISTAATACPKCGAPSSAERMAKFGRSMTGCGCLMTLFITIPFLFILFSL